MSSNRDDDIVIRLDFDGPGDGVREKARQDRAGDRQAKRASRIGQRVRRTMTARATGMASSVLNTATRGVSGRATTAGRSVARVASTNPMSLIAGAAVAIVATLGVAAIRIGSGKTFEGIGEEVKERLFGDLDEKAIAGAGARNALLAQPGVSAMLGAAEDDPRYAGVRQQFEAIHRARADHDEIALQGRSRVLRSTEFQVNGTLDNIIISAWDRLKAKWLELGGETTMYWLRWVLRGAVSIGSSFAWATSLPRRAESMLQFSSGRRAANGASPPAGVGR